MRRGLRTPILACFPEKRTMALVAQESILRWLFAAAVCLVAALAGCYVGYKTYTEHYSAADTALGEEHELNLPASDALQLTEDALRGDGLLFELQPDDSLMTLWRD